MSKQPYRKTNDTKLMAVKRVGNEYVTIAYTFGSYLTKEQFRSILKSKNINFDGIQSVNAYKEKGGIHWLIPEHK